MKLLTAILIFLCLSVQCMTQIAVLGLFRLKQDYIAKNLCENRDKPKMSCCGKCYLGKQLRKTDEEGKTSGSTPVKTLKSEVMPCVVPAPFQAEAPAFVMQSPIVRRPVLRQLHDRLDIAAIFHPPAALS